MQRLVLGLLFLIGGPLLGCSGALRLGIGRHGRFDLGFLGNEMTAAHVENLLCFGGGIVITLVGFWLVVAAPKRTRT